ncbi:hypothetical protein FRC07_004647 [Ceratobasidium sp. 392]|nr:hypothetical protein FRC07_004647 [Ceratobasidium sp. 392]
MTLRYLEDIHKDIPSPGGMYATAVKDNVEVAALTGSDSQMWQFAIKGRGMTIQRCVLMESVPPVDPPAWKNDSPKPGTPITLSSDASTYYINIIPHRSQKNNGWVVTMCPMGTWIGVDRYIGASKGDQVEIVGEPIDGKTSFPGWFVEEYKDTD